MQPTPSFSRAFVKPPSIQRSNRLKFGWWISRGVPSERRMAAARWVSSALYCVTVALPFMRAQKDGLLIHTASMAGRFIGGLSGPIYTAAKHGVVAMSHTINMEECINGIRSTVFLPGEVATPILDKRPNPVSPDERARMVQPQDCGDLIRYIACLPEHLVMNEVMLAPTYNRGYVANLQRKL